MLDHHEGLLVGNGVPGAGGGGGGLGDGIVCSIFLDLNAFGYLSSVHKVHGDGHQVVSWSLVVVLGQAGLG